MSLLNKLQIEFNLIVQGRVLNIAGLIAQIFMTGCIMNTAAGLFVVLMIVFTLQSVPIDSMHEMVKAFDKTTNVYQVLENYGRSTSIGADQMLAMAWLNNQVAKIEYIKIVAFLVVASFVGFIAVRKSIVKAPAILTPNNNSADAIAQVQSIIGNFTSFPAVAIGNRTCVHKKKLFISLYDFKGLMGCFKEQVLFKVDHELFHYQSMDTSIGYATKIFCRFNSIILCVSWSFLLFGMLSIAVDFHGANYILLPVFVGGCYFFYRVFSESYNTIARHNEHLADANAVKHAKDNSAALAALSKLDIPTDDLHPSGKERINFIISQESTSLVKVFIYANLLWMAASFPFLDIPLFNSTLQYYGFIIVTLPITFLLFSCKAPKYRYVHMLAVLIPSLVAVIVQPVLVYIYAHKLLNVFSSDILLRPSMIGRYAYALYIVGIVALLWLRRDHECCKDL